METKTALGFLSSIITQYLGASPFQSDQLDKLADAMQIPEILQQDRLKRYFRVSFLQDGCLSYIDRIFFDAEYLNALLPEELLAAGAHEFTHIKERDGRKLFYRIFGFAIAIAFLIGCIVFVDFELLKPLLFFSNSGKGVSSLFAGALSYLPAWLVSFYVNAKWNRQRETESDRNAVTFANGEAMISALTKLSKLHPKKAKRFKSRFLPLTYPTLDQRINDIRSAMKSKTNRIPAIAVSSSTEFDLHLRE